VTARLAVRVHPGARRDALVGWMEDGTLKLSVRVAPEGGRANAAVVGSIAAALDVPRRQVTVTRGQAARAKTIAIEGLDQAEVRRRIDAALQRREGEHGE
jgi:uncharacterized protein YggU (UPF0235/DUF167 family)